MTRLSFCLIRIVLCSCLCFSIGLILSSCNDEMGSSRIRPEYSIVTTVAGNGTSGFDDGVGSTARFNQPSAMVVDDEGNLYVSDHENHSIRKVTPFGEVSTFAGTGQPGSQDGDRLNASFNHPYGLALDPNGNLYVGDVSNHSIRKISADGRVTTLAGGRRGFSDRKGELAMFDHPHGVALDSKSNVYVADSYNNRIRKVAPDGTTTTVAGNGNDGFIDGGAEEAEFFVPIGIAIDDRGNIYVGDEGNSSIRKISANGKVKTLAGNGKFSFSDGVGTNASFNAPGAIAIDRAGNLYVADYLNNCIRRVSALGEVRKIAGKLDKGFADGAASEALFYYPFGIAVDETGVVYVGDHFNHRIRKID
jgi:sugar lactone lactonase YvrE